MVYGWQRCRRQRQLETKQEHRIHLLKQFKRRNPNASNEKNNSIECESSRNYSGHHWNFESTFVAVTSMVYVICMCLCVWCACTSNTIEMHFFSVCLYSSSFINLIIRFVYVRFRRLTKGKKVRWKKSCMESSVEISVTSSSIHRHRTAQLTVYYSMEFGTNKHTYTRTHTQCVLIKIINRIASHRTMRRRTADTTTHTIRCLWMPTFVECVTSKQFLAWYRFHTHTHPYSLKGDAIVWVCVCVKLLLWC